MTSNYKQDENQLVKIVKEQVEPCDENSRINLTIFIELGNWANCS